MGRLRRWVSSLIKPIKEENYRRREREKERQKREEMPSFDPAFFSNLTWRCTNCGNEFWDQDNGVVCHYCEANYTLSKDDFPELLRAKCWNCGEISTEVGGYRSENIRFDCPNCYFEWESDPY